MIPILIIIIISGAIFFIAINITKKKRKEYEMQFLEVNKNRAIVSLYSNNTKINGIEVSRLNSIRAGKRQRIVALETCTHTFEGHFFAIDTKLTDYRSEKVKFSVELKNGYTYTLGLYFSQPEKSCYAPKAIFVLPLEMKNSEINAYIICYQEI